MKDGAWRQFKKHVVWLSMHLSIAVVAGQHAQLVDVRAPLLP